MAKKPTSKSKHKNIQAWKKYKFSGSVVARPPSCPRCGIGTTLARHKDRTTCGRCGFSETGLQRSGTAGSGLSETAKKQA